ncbi:MAG TPA: hypothetical protein VF792_13090 [Ktedonobacterales bacterium]
MTDLPELEAAKHQLEGHGGYDWLLEGKAFWSVNQVVEALTEHGRQVSVSTVTRWFRSLPHTQGSSGPGGLTASRNDLILLFARQMSPRT